jgi:hypothetical protein
MALNYAGLSTTPAALNSFLNNPNVAGYTDDGLIQWSIATDAASTSALSPFRLSPQVTLKFVPDVNDSVSNPQAAEAALSNALCGSKPHPVIVGVDFTQAENGQLVAGHFVLVTGKTTLPDQSVRFSIQDPYFNDDSNNNYGSSNTPAYTYLDQHGSHYRTTGYVIDPSGDFSRLSLNISGIVAMKLVDPLGRSTGFDPVSGSILSEIPQSGYWTDHLNNDSTGIVATGANTFIDVFQPQVGAYLVAQTALARGPYVLNLRSIAQDGTLQADNNVSGGVNRGSTATANIELQTIPGSSSSIAAIPGDINGDGIVNCTDLAIIKASFGKKVGQIGFDPRGDLNLDGIVDIRDLALVARYVSPGTECP